MRRKRIALAIEVPLAFRGGVNVIFEALAAAISRHYDVILVSPDPSLEAINAISRQFLSGHVHCDPARLEGKRAAEVAATLKDREVDLAHFHCGGTYGWGNRRPGGSPIPHLAKSGIPCVTTAHLARSILDGYCAAQKPLWFKLAFLPAGWLAKLHVLRHTRVEITVSQSDYHHVRQWYFPLRSKFAQIYHSRIECAAGTGEPATVPPPREKIILNVGHVALRKGQPVLAEAFARLASRHPDWKLWLAGDIAEQPAGDRIREIAQRRGLQERLVLLGPRQDAFELMRQASIFVLPSFFEG